MKDVINACLLGRLEGRICVPVIVDLHPEGTPEKALAVFTSFEEARKSSYHNPPHISPLFFPSYREFAEAIEDVCRKNEAKLVELNPGTGSGERTLAHVSFLLAWIRSQSHS